MQLQVIIRKVPWLLWIVLVLFLVNWLFYLPFINFGWLGIYPLATFYRQIFSFPAALLTTLFLWFWMGVVIISALSILLLFFVRKYRYRRTLLGLLTLPLITVAIFPLSSTCVHKASLDVTPWGKSYRVAYTAFATDDTYGSRILFECDRTGIFCRQLKTFADDKVMTVNLQYDPKFDHLTLSKPGASTALYRRSRHKVICNEPDSLGTSQPECTVNP